MDFGRLSNFDRICREHGVPIETDADDAEGTLVAVVRFRKLLHDQSTGNMRQGPGRPKAAATPANKAKAAAGLPKARLTFTPSGVKAVHPMRVPLNAVV